MNRQQLQVFVEVAYRGSFWAAGEELNQHYQHIGSEVRALESSLDCQLFWRLTPAAPLYPMRTVRLTSAGAAFLSYAERALQEADDSRALQIAAEGKAAISRQ